MDFDQSYVGTSPRFDRTTGGTSFDASPRGDLAGADGDDYSSGAVAVPSSRGAGVRVSGMPSQPKAAPRSKVLLMGKSGAGKTSMRSIIFANFAARQTESLEATHNVERSSLRFLGDLVLSLWDCGGQDQLYDTYFNSEREGIFSGVALMIYVFSVVSKEIDKDMEYYRGTMAALQQFSPDAKVVCLVHKMDLVANLERERKLAFHEEAIRANSVALRSTGKGAMGVDVHPTTIWDESLYAAWSQIVHRLVPNINSLEKKVHSLCAACGADEAVLFERTTFLVLTTASRRPHKDGHRHEKLSNIVKQFKLSCANASAEFAAMTISGSRFKAVLEALTEHTFVLLVISDPAVPEGAVVLNVKAARPAFQIALDGAISGSSSGSAGAGRSARAPGAAGGGAATGGAGGGKGAIEESKADGETDVARGDVSRSSGVASQAITAASFGGTPGGARGGAFGDASLASPARGMGAGAEGSGSGGGLR